MRRFAQILPPGTRQYLVVRNADRIVSARPDVVQDLSRSFRQPLVPDDWDEVRTSSS